MMDGGKHPVGLNFLTEMKYLAKLPKNLKTCAMNKKKEPIEIECPACHVKFRLWVPLKLLPQWKMGEEIGCIQCKSPLLVSREGDKFKVQSLLDVEAQSEEAKKEKVLIVDDDALVRKMTEDALIGLGVRPMIAKNAEEALRILEKNDISAMVVDLYLKSSADPGSTMDGEDFLRIVMGKGKSIPSIVITGKELIDDLIPDPKWYELRVKCFIQKGNPFWIDELVVKVKEMLKRDR